MEKVTLIAMFACIAKFLTSFVYFLPYMGNDVWLTAYNISELLIWILLAIFFFGYWQRRKKIAKMKEQHRQQHQNDTQQPAAEPAV